MNKIIYSILALLLLTSSVAFASQFNQDRMLVTPENILIHSAFSGEDHITAYDDYGNFLWDATFTTEIISWKLKNGYLYVFSKSRYLSRTHLTCINPITGTIIWERP